MEVQEIVDELERLGQPDNLAAMARYGITPERAYGVKMPELRRLARRARTKHAAANHALAGELWALDTRETRVLASMVDEPALVDDAQIEAWVVTFDYWEICDQCCMNLFEKMPVAYDKAVAWALRDEAYVKRAGFVLMARLAVSDKQATDDAFRPFFARIEQEAADPRMMVKKGISWALRQIGKRNQVLNAEAIAVAERLTAQEDRHARWVGRDAQRELTSAAVQGRLPA